MAVAGVGTGSRLLLGGGWWVDGWWMDGRGQRADGSLGGRH